MATGTLRFLGLAAVTLVFAAAPSRARAQSSRVSVDAALGFAHVGGGWYGDRSRIGGRGRVDVRIATLGATQFILGASGGWYGGHQPQLIAPAVLCVNTAGQAVPCYPPQPPSAPNVLYLGAHFGVRHPISRLLMVEADAGAGVARTSPGASPDRLGISGDVDVVLGGASRMKLVCGIQLLTLRDAGARLYAYPLTIGLRFQ